MEPIILCPNCDEYIVIEKINCGIFRHGILKGNNKQLDPHLNKETCMELKNRNLIYGCGKPFQIIIENNNLIIRKCDYI